MKRLDGVAWFQINIKVDVVVLANVVRGLARKENRNALKNMNRLGQEAFRLAQEKLEQWEIKDIESALEVLEEEGIIDKRKEAKVVSIQGEAFREKGLNENG